MAIQGISIILCFDFSEVLKSGDVVSLSSSESKVKQSLLDTFNYGWDDSWECIKEMLGKPFTVLEVSKDNIITVLHPKGFEGSTSGKMPFPTSVVEKRSGKKIKSKTIDNYNKSII